MIQLRSAATLLMSMCAAALAACSTPSINPIYSDDQNEVVKDDRVVGLWASEDPKKKDDRYRVSAVEHSKGAAPPGNDDRKQPQPVHYKLTIEDEAGNAKKNAEFELRVVRLGATDFIDVFPANSEVRNLGDRYALAALPTHIIMPVVISEDRITVRPLDLAKVKNLLAEVPGMTPHTIRDKDVVILTGSPRQVQEFFRKVSGDDQIFDDPLELKRIDEANPPAKPEAEKPVKEPVNAPARGFPKRIPKPKR